MAPPKQNAFMMFVHEWNKSRSLPIATAVNQCGEIWKNMSEQERRPYKGLAKDANISNRAVKEPLDCRGRALSEVDRSEREAAGKEMKNKRAIENIVLGAKAQHELEHTEFMFAAFNYFVKAIGSDVYIPAEFAACQFSLKSGKISIYSSHINPGQLIFGQGRDTQHHTTTTHQLPLPPKALGEENMGRLYDNIVEYLRNCQGESKPLVVFTTTDLIPVVTGCFRYLQSDSDDLDALIEVYDIQYLFYVLKKEVMDIADLPLNNLNKSVTDNFFLKDFFEYSAGIACQFHEDNDRGRYCTQSMVSRWCYTFCDYMCGDLAITPLPGKHMPPPQAPKFRVTNANQSFGGNTSYASCQSKMKQEPESDYEPTDHSVFSGDLSATEEFPSLGGRKPKSKSNRNPVANDWNVPAANRSVDELGDAFNMSRR